MIRPMLAVFVCGSLWCHCTTVSVHPGHAQHPPRRPSSWATTARLRRRRRSVAARLAIDLLGRHRAVDSVHEPELTRFGPAELDKETDDVNRCVHSQIVRTRPYARWPNKLYFAGSGLKRRLRSRISCSRSGTTSNPTLMDKILRLIVLGGIAGDVCASLFVVLLAIYMLRFAIVLLREALALWNEWVARPRYVTAGR
jgi:hypothetical protein